MRFLMGLASLLIAGEICQAETPKSAGREYSFHYDHILGTSLDVWMRAASEADAAVAEKAILDEIERLRLVFSTFEPKSEISRLNLTKGPVAASPELLEVLREYDLWQRRSNGAFNGQLGELVRIWKEAEKSGREPDQLVLASIVQQVNQRGWQIDDEHQTVARLTDQPLNLNAIGKGYIIKKAAEAARLKVPGLRGLLLNIGGDMLGWGNGPEGWVVGVQDPFKPEDNAPLIAALRLNGMAVATSGGYQRYYRINGKKYSHIFDPRTGCPAEGVASATVVAPTNIVANALATTLCVLTPQEGLRLVASTPGAECLIITSDGRQLKSAGLKLIDMPKQEFAITTEETKDAKAWQAGYQVAINVELPSINAGKRYRRPYVAVWIENDDGKPVRTLTVWGNAPKYLRDLYSWWKFASGDNTLIRSVTRATRGPGKYEVVWDGKDDKGKLMPQGTYTVKVEVHREHGKHLIQTGKVECGAESSKATLEKNAETEATEIEYRKKK